MPATVLDEPAAGKVFALQRGCRAVEQQWVVTCDADTYYPPHYLETAERLLVEPAAPAPPVVALLALPLPAATEVRAQVAADRLALARRYPDKCFTGSFGQVFRTDMLRQVGGFDPRIGPMS